MPSRGADLVAIVEAAYRVDAGDGEWLDGIAAACRPALDAGFGLCAFEFKYETGSVPTCLQERMLGMPPDLEAIYPTVFRNMPPAIRLLPFAKGPCVTGSQMMGLKAGFKGNELMQRFAQKFGIYDSMWITAAEPSGWGCGLHAGRPQIGWASRTTIAHWSRVAAHISAAARLRRRVTRVEGDASTADVEAVFSPDGQLHHAEDAAKESNSIERLRRAVVDIERARGPQRTENTLGSLNGWKGLVHGRWTLVDSFESDGKRYVLARENAPRPPGVAALTLREQQVAGYAALGHDNKVIAYDLGIAHSTVKVLMARAATKLGVGSREELIAAYNREVSGSAVPAASEEPPGTEGPSIS